MSKAVEVKNLSKVYKLYAKPSDRIKEAMFPKRFGEKIKSFYALRDVSFKIDGGETVGIIGKNGSGKSTLLKILTGVINPTSGEKLTDGKISALLELGAGFNPEYTGIENIYLNGTIMGFSREQMKSRVRDICDFAEIGDFVEQPVKSYSSGMFVRLAFAVAINVEPDILIVDEALAVGDYRFQAKCYNKFEELKGKGKTILFVSHDVDAVRRFCTRCIWIDCGKVVMDGDVNEVTSKYMEFITGGEKNADDIINGGNQAADTENKNKEEHGQTFNAINRFGSHVGCIKSVELLAGDTRKDVFECGEEIRVRITADIPETADLKKVGAAISVKNKNGLDLFVTALSDENIAFEHSGRNTIEISFDNRFNAGEYTLIAALEDRTDVPIKYYDYIEGAAYIKSVCDREYFGLVRLPSKIKLGE